MPYTVAAGKTPSDLVEIGIAGTREQVYAWYDARDVSAGISTDLDNFRPRFRYAVVTPPCDVFADPPQRQGPDPGFVLGIASRGPSCEESSSITVQLVHERRLWFDRVLKEVSGGGTNFDLPIRLDCSGREGRRLYLKVKGDGHEKESARASIQFCF